MTPETAVRSYDKKVIYLGFGQFFAAETLLEEKAKRGGNRRFGDVCLGDGGSDSKL